MYETELTAEGWGYCTCFAVGMQSSRGTNSLYDDADFVVCWRRRRIQVGKAAVGTDFFLMYMYIYIYKNARCVDIGISSSSNKSLSKPPPINKPNLSLSLSTANPQYHKPPNHTKSHQTKPNNLPQTPQNVPPLHPLPPSSQRQKRPRPSNPPHPSPKSPTNQLFNHKTHQPHLHLVRQQPLIRRANFFSISDFECRVEKCYC